MERPHQRKREKTQKAPPKESKVGAIFLPTNHPVPIPASKPSPFPPSIFSLDRRSPDLGLGFSMKGIWENPAAAAAEAKKPRPNRRPNRRPRQTPGGGCVSVERCTGTFNSLPAMHVNGGGEPMEVGVSSSCPLPGSSSVPFKSRRCMFDPRCVFDPYWPEEAVEEAIKNGVAFQAKFRVNAHNHQEAYCTIEGVPTDVLINGAIAQNRAIEGDIVAIVLDPVTAWTKLKGSNAANNPALEDDSSTLNEVREVGNCENHPCNNSLLPPDRLSRCPENGEASGSIAHDPGNLPGTLHNRLTEHYSTSPENSSAVCPTRQGEAARALERICTVISSFPLKRPTGRVLSILKKSPRRDAVTGFLAVNQWFSAGEVCETQFNRQFSKINNSNSASYGKEYIQLVPTDSKFPVMVVSVSSLPNTLKERLNNVDVTVENELVAAQIDEWSDGKFYPEAHVIHSLGRGGEIEPQIAAIMFENAIIAASFSPESLDCLPDIPWKIPTQEFETRKDLRNICTFTIDPSSAIDLDDALSVEKISDESFRIGVHIADVSYFVRPDTALDTEAQIRSTSVYILKHKLAMLPQKLSEELGSLVPGIDRLAVSVVLDINRSGDIIDRWVGRSIIRSSCKLSYDLVQDIIDGKLGSDHDLADSGSSRPQLHGGFGWKNIIQSVASLHEISKTLKENRFKDGALWFENAKLVFLFDECGTPYDSFLNERKESCSIVEEFMLLANRSVAEIISRVFPDCALLRRHPEPNLRKLKEFGAFCSRHGLELDTSSSGKFHLSLSKIRKKLKNDPVLFDILVSYASKPMQSAAYFCTGDLRGRENDWAHYALSVPFYTHFTSPLRRYPDIIVHRTLCAALDAEEMYLKRRCIVLEMSNGGTSGVKTAGRCFTGLHFDKDAAESDEGREAFSAAALKYKIPETEVLGEVAAYCNERKLASRQAEESGEKLYLWALLKKKMVIVSEARVVGLGPRFMSVYVNRLGIERRVYYADIEGLIVEWLESTCTLVLDLFGTKPFRRRGYPSKFRPIEEAALVKNPSEETPAEEDTETSEAMTGMETLEIAEKSEASPVFFPLVLKNLSAVPVALHAIGGENGPLDIGVRLYMCSYFK